MPAAKGNKFDNSKLDNSSVISGEQKSNAQLEAPKKSQATNLAISVSKKSMPRKSIARFMSR